MKDRRAEVTYNNKVSECYYQIALAMEDISFESGQFVMVQVPDDVVFLRRPFSISKTIDGGIELLYKVVGPGTKRISELTSGESVNILAPLGKGFSVPKDLKKAILVAGGFGIAPFVELTSILANKGIQTSLYYGGRGANDILFLDDFEKKGVDCHISTEDGSLGHKGLITELLLKDLANYSKNKDNQRATSNEQQIYCCGPKGLTEAVVKLAKENSIPAEVSYETYMGCGIGACLGCAVETKDGYKRACKDGPVFQVDELI